MNFIFKTPWNDGNKTGNSTHNPCVVLEYGYNEQIVVFDQLWRNSVHGRDNWVF